MISEIVKTVAIRPVDRGYVGCRTATTGHQYCKDCDNCDNPIECENVRVALGAKLILPRSEILKEWM